jgi:hypothetical protein
MQVHCDPQANAKPEAQSQRLSGAASQTIDHAETPEACATTSHASLWDSRRWPSVRWLWRVVRQDALLEVANKVLRQQVHQLHRSFDRTTKSQFRQHRKEEAEGEVKGFLEMATPEPKEVSPVSSKGPYHQGGTCPRLPRDGHHPLAM